MINDACTRCLKLGAKLYASTAHYAQESRHPVKKERYCKPCIEQTYDSFRDTHTLEYDELNATYSFVNNDTNMELVGAIP